MDAITAIAIHDTFMRTDGSVIQVASVVATWMAGGRNRCHRNHGI